MGKPQRAPDRVDVLAGWFAITTSALAALSCRLDAASARVAIRSASASASAPSMFKVRE